jgi:S-adenosylmethionine-diacylglycerol 3-amino-3-carboxypropyl transferase
MSSNPNSTEPETCAGPAGWVCEAARRPVAFAQVREDALLDLFVVNELDGPVEVLMVASGGCTAAALAASEKIARLTLVDPNSAQLALARLKLRLLQTSAPPERLAILGHQPMAEKERQIRLEKEFAALNLPPDSIGPIEHVAAEGPDYCGRYEVLFSKLREELASLGSEIRNLLELRDTFEQSRRIGTGTSLFEGLVRAFESVMALPNLIGLFGEGATRNRVEPFSRHFFNRIMRVLETLPAADNPYLWQLLVGRFPDGLLFPWLNLDSPRKLPELNFVLGDMAGALSNFDRPWDFIHLSNILDWLSPQDAEKTLALACEALRPGGRVIIRQLNSNLDIPSLGRRFSWSHKEANALHFRDRSFFYRGIFLGRKRG